MENKKPSNIVPRFDQNLLWVPPKRKSKKIARISEDLSFLEQKSFNMFSNDSDYNFEDLNKSTGPTPRDIVTSRYEPNKRSRSIRTCARLLAKSRSYRQFDLPKLDELILEKQNQNS